VPARAGAQRVPEDLRIHVRVAVDEAGRHDPAIGVDDLARRFADATDGRDAPVTNGDVGSVAGKSGSVDHRAVLDQQVIRHRVLLPSTRQGTAGPAPGGSGPTEDGARECAVSYVSSGHAAR